MIIRYIYDDRKGRQLIGCVCRLENGRLGYSAVHPRDRRKLTKKLARAIAVGRATKCEVYGYPADGHWYRMRNGLNGSAVPRVIAPHLAALIGV